MPQDRSSKTSQALKGQDNGWAAPSALKLQLNLVKICRSLDEEGLAKSEAYPLWIW